MSGSRPRRFRVLASLAAVAGLLAGTAAGAQRAAMDPSNPTCPLNPNWSANRQMTFTVLQRPGQRPVLLAEGVVDDDLIPRLAAALNGFQGDEIWLRSPGGNAEVGNQAGRLIRTQNFQTRIPAGWACFSACNFLFMGGTVRFVDPGGLFIVHMFTYTADRQAIRGEMTVDEDRATRLINGIEQGSAMLASEDNVFLVGMGVAPSLLTEVMYQVPVAATPQSRETRRCLTQEQVRRYNVATRFIAR
ncbi:MAG TPA: hypothetical protein VGO55_00980 [Allosphingosinicella sp.]|jgi:hypothetical protein|nr:hypothetical protein [Allosphingosinicella sp.]